MYRYSFYEVLKNVNLRSRISIFFFSSYSIPSDARTRIVIPSHDIKANHNKFLTLNTKNNDIWLQMPRINGCMHAFPLYLYSLLIKIENLAQLYILWYVCKATWHSAHFIKQRKIIIAIRECVYERVYSSFFSLVSKVPYTQQTTRHLRIRIHMADSVNKYNKILYKRWLMI